MKKELLSRRIAIVSYKYADRIFQLVDYSVSYPLGKFVLYKDHMLISGPFKKIELKYNEIKTFKWRLFVGTEFAGIIIKHNNSKYPKLIGISNGFFSKTLYKDVVNCLIKHKIKLKLDEKSK